MTKREYGAGSIERRVYNGKTRYRTRVWLADGTRRSLGEYATEAEATGVLSAAAEQIEAAGLAPQRGISLAAYGDQWLSHRERDGKRNAHKERSCWKKHVARERFAQTPLSQLTKRDIRDWARALTLRRVTQTIRTKSGTTTKTLDRTLARETVKHALNLVHLCLDEAVIDGHLDSNPAHGIKAPAQPHTKDKWTFLTQPEIDLIVSCEHIPEEKRLLFQFAIYSGLRAGEMWGLLWSDVSLDRAEPQIVVRFSRNRPTKSGKPRELLLLPPAAEALRRLRELQTAPHRLVFPATTGGVHGEGADGNWSDRKTKHGVKVGHKTRAGITRHVRFHDLRHTCASHLISGTWGRDWRLEEVRDYLGHSNISVTQRYAHLSPKAMRAAVAGTTCAEAAAPIHRPATRAATIAAQPVQLPAAVQTIRRHQLGPKMAPKVASAADGHAENRMIPPAHPPRFEHGTVGLEGRCSSD